MSELHVQEKTDSKNPNSISFEARKRQIEEDQRLEKEEHERRKKSPYRSWVQMNKDAYKAEDWLMSKSPMAYRVFKFLINNMDSYNAVMCSYKVLQEQFSVSSDTINKQIAWNSWGSNFKHGKFSANIILSDNEQEKDMKLKIEKHKEIKTKDDEK